MSIATIKAVIDGQTYPLTFVGGRVLCVGGHRTRRIQRQ